MICQFAVAIQDPVYLTNDVPEVPESAYAAECFQKRILEFIERTEELLHLHGVREGLAQVVQLRLIEEQPLDADTCHRLAHVAYLAARETQHRVGLHLTHLIGEQQHMLHLLIIGLHLHRLYPLAA